MSVATSPGREGRTNTTGKEKDGGEASLNFCALMLKTKRKGETGGGGGKKLTTRRRKGGGVRALNLSRSTHVAVKPKRARRNIAPRSGRECWGSYAVLVAQSAAARKGERPRVHQQGPPPLLSSFRWRSPLPHPPSAPDKAAAAEAHSIPCAQFVERVEEGREEITREGEEADDDDDRDRVGSSSHSSATLSSSFLFAPPKRSDSNLHFSSGEKRRITWNRV